MKGVRGSAMEQELHIVVYQGNVCLASADRVNTSFSFMHVLAFLFV